MYLCEYFYLNKYIMSLSKKPFGSVRTISKSLKTPKLLLIFRSLTCFAPRSRFAFVVLIIKHRHEFET